MRGRVSCLPFVTSAPQTVKPDFRFQQCCGPLGSQPVYLEKTVSRTLMDREQGTRLRAVVTTVQKRNLAAAFLF